MADMHGHLRPIELADAVRARNKESHILRNRAASSPIRNRSAATHVIREMEQCLREIADHRDVGNVRSIGDTQRATGHRANIPEIGIAGNQIADVDQVAAAK